MSSTRHPVLARPEKLWLRGLIMRVLVLLVNLAQTVLGISAILQFLWMLFASQRSAVPNAPGRWCRPTGDVHLRRENAHGRPSVCPPPQPASAALIPSFIISIPSSPKRMKK